MNEINELERRCKALCQDCKDKPLRVEKIRAFYETTVSYDESIPELAQ